MIDVTVNLYGLSEVEQALRDISNENSIAGAKVIRSAMMSASLPLLRQLQATAPQSPPDLPPRRRKSKRHGMAEIKPGFLKSRIRRRSYINKTGYDNRKFNQDGLVKVRVGAFVPYAHYVELGTEKAPAQPFIRSAIDSQWQSIIQNFRTLLSKRLAAYRRRQTVKSS